MIYVQFTSKTKSFIEEKSIFNELTFKFISFQYLDVICFKQAIVQMTGWHVE